MIDRVEPSITELIGRIDSAVSADNDELSSLRRELASLRRELAALRAVAAERDQALREAELTLSQLHQSQEELQHYYLLCKRQSEMLESSADLQTRSFVLLMDAIN
jgi:chromosome segregation ATPase